MEVILLERIEKLGQMGDVVNVKPGFARNYLLPQKKAVTATDTNRKQFEARRAQLEAQNLERKGEAEKIAGKVDGLFVTMIRQAGDAGQLYGSVNARDIAIGVTEAGFTVARRQVNLDQPIKTVGLHPVRIALHPEVSVTVMANVARSLEEARIQEETGEAVIRTEEETEEVATAEEMFEPGAGPAEEAAAEEGGASEGRQ
jgi:large subunit ribosomal protein L9